MKTRFLFTSLLAFGFLAQTLQAAVGLEKLADGMVNPLNLVSIGDASGTLLIGDQQGTVHVLKNGKLQDALFLELRSKLCKQNDGFDERGLLGLALHPNFKDNGRLFIYYSAPLRSGAPSDWDHTSHISEFKTLDGNLEKADPESEKILMRIDQPGFNHNGGRLAFGPEGNLYISVGDGGGANDNENGHTSGIGNGQDVSKLSGKILRIDVDKGQPYGIPSDNPFVGKQGRNEIYAFGIRNPWGMSFDSGGTHELFVSDVGQNRFEEVNIITRGGNYGWRLREATEGFDPDKPNSDVSDPAVKDAFGNALIDPVITYKNKNRFRNDPTAYGVSVTGGFIYRGKAIPELQGKYVFADWSGSWAQPNGILLVASRSDGLWTLDHLDVKGSSDSNLKLYISAFGQDAAGELYVLTSGVNGLQGIGNPSLRSGAVYKIVP